MMVYCDTSALYALMDADDENHRKSAQTFDKLLIDDAQLVCNNYVLNELLTLLQRRLGMEALRAYLSDIAPLVRVTWIDESAHQRALTALLTTNQRPLSLTDCASFDTMRQLSITHFFAYDQHFAKQGFTQFRS